MSCLDFEGFERLGLEFCERGWVDLQVLIVRVCWIEIDLGFSVRLQR